MIWNDDTSTSTENRSLKQVIVGLTILIIGITSCQSDKKSLAKNKHYVETDLSFFKPDDKDFGRSTWIRSTNNIKIAHETFKKVGYKRLLNNHFYQADWCWILGNVDKPCDEIIDSLLITFDCETTSAKYYREFWNRRKTEQNDSIVFSVLREVWGILYNDSIRTYDEKLVNDTLFNLIEIKEFEFSMTKAKARDNFNYLKRIGLHNSAYNLLFERYGYYDVEWNEEELSRSLFTDTTKCCLGAFIEDDTK